MKKEYIPFEYFDSFEQYTKVFEQIPILIKMAEEPFSLKILLTILPSLVKSTKIYNITKF